MCGIAGFSGNFNIDFLKQANSILAHRGPDDEGIWFNQDKSIGLAHRRLSIIDLSKNAKQPMKSISNNTIITYNGELYNFIELKKQLQDKGYTFKTNSDTEVLLYMYEEYSNKMLDYLNGIFAFAILDIKKNELFIAKDQLGVKPLYYACNKKGFIFSSELKALLKVKDLDTSINEEAIHYYIGYLWSPSPHTMIKSIKKLEPGHALIIKDGIIKKMYKYYDLPYGNDYLEISQNDIQNELSIKIQKAVKRQLISDVPIGTFLSGGLDSTTITYFANKFNSNKSFDSFTIGFDNKNGQFDGFTEDLPYAKKFAYESNINLNTIFVNSEKLIKRFEDMIYFLDEPQADPAPLNVLFICELAKKNNIKVLLSGTGGDDLFSGYRRHAALHYDNLISWLPNNIKTSLKYIFNNFPQNNTIGRRLSRLFRFADKSFEERLIGYFTWMDESIQRSLYSKDFTNLLKNTHMFTPLLNTYEKIKHIKSPLNKMLYLEKKHFLADHNLNYTDKMGMSQGIEIRVPLLDLDLVNFACRIPPRYKFKNNQLKYIFKKSMEKFLPKEIIYRPKTGFGMPLRSWLHGELKDVLNDLLSESSIKKRNFFDYKNVKKLIDNDFKGNIDATYSIFSLMCIEWWMRIFIDGNN